MGLQVLIVDDSEAERGQLMDALMAGGYKTVHLCHSGSEALAHLGVEPANQSPELSEPDAILLDVGMSAPDGIETCALIRTDARYRYTPILIVSDETDVATLAQAFIAGGNDYLRKPFEQLELLARLRAALRLKSEIDRRVVRHGTRHPHAHSMCSVIASAWSPEKQALSTTTRTLSFMTLNKFRSASRLTACGWPSSPSRTIS